MFLEFVFEWMQIFDAHLPFLLQHFAEILQDFNVTDRLH